MAAGSPVCSGSGMGRSQHLLNLGEAEATEKSAQRLLAGRLLLDQSQLAVIGVANLPMLDLHGSGQIKSLVTRIASEIRQSPSLTVFLVAPPKQPVFGTGKVSKLVGEQKVLAHQELWRAELEAADGTYLHRCTGLYDHDSMYSDERDLGVELWCVAADIPEDASASAKSVFSTSVLLKRKAVPGFFAMLSAKVPCSTSAKTWRLPMQATPMVMETLSVSWCVNLLG